MLWILDFNDSFLWILSFNDSYLRYHNFHNQTVRINIIDLHNNQSSGRWSLLDDDVDFGFVDSFLWNVRYY